MIRFGLRAQLVVALSVVFLISFALLGTATLRLTRAASDADLERTEQLMAEMLAATAASGDATIDELWDRAEGVRPVTALRLTGPEGSVELRGEVPDWPGSTVRTAAGGRLSVWLPRASRPSYLPLGNLLLFYVGMTGLAVLVLTYFALTHLTIRPLDRLTRSSEQLAAGAAHVRVPERGAPEVARLAAAFNAMAEQLKNERSALEERLHELETTTVELKTAQQQIIHGEKLASVGRLAAGVAHEIGNPLSAILGLVELLQSGEHSPEEQAEFLARIHRETERIHGIIRDLLDFSRRDPNADAADQTSDLEQAVQDAVNLVQTQKESRGVTIDVDLGQLEGRVVAPQHRLTQVVLNLVLNALDALDGAGRVELRASSTSDDVCLQVADDGPGIDPGMLDRLFDPFTTTKPVGKGTGLGLAVCHALVEAVGGRIEAENLPGGGARFSVHLRRARGATPIS